MINLKQFAGIITALITPFDREGRVEHKALGELIRFQLNSGVDGFFTCGTAGSGAIMKADQRKEVSEAVVVEVKGKVPVIVNVGAPDTETSVELAIHAEKVEADALACVTPYFYDFDQEALVNHYVRVTKSVDLPVFLYNLPKRTGINLSVELVTRIQKAARNIVGIKDSSRDFAHLLEFLEKFPKEFIVINGSDSYIFPALTMGAQGAISGYANPFPEVYVQLFEAYRRKEYSRAVELQFRINRVRRILSQTPIAPLHEALAARGIDAGTVRSPLRPLTKTESRELTQQLRQIGFFTAKEG